MRKRSVIGVFLLGVLALVSIAPIAVSAAGSPSISITSPRNGTVLHGTSISLTVSVSNFKLVPPALHGAPVLKGNTGTIEYALDTAPKHATASNFSSSLSHRWSNLAAGRHVLWAFLVTSKMVPVPDTKPAHVTIVVSPATRPRPEPKPPVHAGGPGVSSGPRTGGGAGVENNPLNVSLLLAGIAAFTIGLAALSRRFAFAGFSGFRSSQEPVENADAPIPTPPDYPTSPAHDVMANAETAANPTTPAEKPPTETADDSDASLPTPMPVEETPMPSAPGADRLESVTEVPMPLESQPASQSAPEPALVEPVSTGMPTGQPAPIGQQPAIDTGFDRTPAPLPTGSSVRDQAVAMARQWASVVEGLVRQLDEQEAERRSMRDRMNMLESRLQAAETSHDEVWQQLRQRMNDSISGDDLSSVRYVTDSLMRDPDHIVVLAAVAQNAGKLHELVESYIGMRQALDSLNR